MNEDDLTEMPAPDHDDLLILSGHDFFTLRLSELARSRTDPICPPDDSPVWGYLWGPASFPGLMPRQRRNIDDPKTSL